MSPPTPPIGPQIHFIAKAMKWIGGQGGVGCIPLKRGGGTVSGIRHFIVEIGENGQ